MWASNVAGGFSIAEDKDGEDLGRGTLIRIHLKEASQGGAEAGQPGQGVPNQEDLQRSCRFGCMGVGWYPQDAAPERVIPASMAGGDH